MRDWIDFLALWAPALVFIQAFIIMGAIVGWKHETRIGNFSSLVRLFLSEGATLKTWGLFLSAFTLLLVVSACVAKVSNDLSWKPTDSTLRLQIFRDAIIGFQLLYAIVLGSLGAVAFKGQLPGGASIQLNQDPAGNQQMSATGPAASAPAAPVAPAVAGGT